jgi:hypothetical protein
MKQAEYDGLSADAPHRAQHGRRVLDEAQTGYRHRVIEGAVIERQMLVPA